MNPQARAWRHTFKSTQAQRIALSLDDRHEFTAALFAAWAERKTVVLPGDVLPATLEALKPHVTRSTSMKMQYRVPSSRSASL